MFFQVIFLLLLLYLHWTTNQRTIPCAYLIHLLVQGHQWPLVCFWVLIAEEAGVGDKVQGDTTMADEQTLLDALLNMSLRSAYYNDKVFFLVTNKNFESWDYFLQCQIQNF